MPEAKVFHCPTCGASLPIPDSAAVKCDYCGSNVVVPAELRKKGSESAAAPIIIQTGAGSSTLRPIITIFVILILIGVLVPIILFAVGAFSLTELFSSQTIAEQGPVFEIVATSNLLPVAPSNQAEILLQFGGEGSGAGQFDDPREIALDLDGNIYVSDYDGGRVQKFSPDGKFIYLINVEPDQNDNVYIKALTSDYAGGLYVVRGGDILIYAKEDGSPDGNIPGVFPTTNFAALAISPANELYAIHDTASGQDLIKLDANGQTLWRQVGFIENVDKEASSSLMKIAVDGLGNTYTIAMNGEMVYKFSPAGAYIDRFGGKGVNEGQFQSPQNISVDGQGRVYVIDTNAIHIFDPNGVFIATLPWDPDLGVMRDAAVDSAGNIIVITLKGQVVKYVSPLDQ